MTEYQRGPTGDTFTGPSLKGAAMSPKNIPFWDRVDRSNGPNACWPWTAAVQSAGYGFNRGKLAHRTAYEDAVGPIPDGLTIDHLCSNRRCCNPSHLEPVTREENARRGERNRLTRSGGRPDLVRRSHCKHGHEFTPDNVRLVGNARICRTCSSDRVRSFRLRKAGMS